MRAARGSRRDFTATAPASPKIEEFPIDDGAPCRFFPRSAAFARVTTKKPGTKAGLAEILLARENYFPSFAT
jgi:hypothetical protein